MSADTDFVDDRAPDAHDPYGIIPEGFVDAYDATSIPEALRKAEQADPCTPTDEMKRCPTCLTVRIRIKVGDPDRDQRTAGAYTCAECSSHFDEPLPPLADAREQAAHAPTATHDAALPRCQGCLSTDLYPVPERAPAVEARWKCFECGLAFDDALPARNAMADADPAARERVGELLTDADSDAVARLEAQADRHREREPAAIGPSEQATFDEVARDE